jgi:hypothetical protein
MTSTLAIGPTPHPSRCISRVFLRGGSGQIMRLITHLDLGLRLRMYGSYLPLSLKLSWLDAQAQILLYQWYQYNNIWLLHTSFEIYKRESIACFTERDFIFIHWGRGTELTHCHQMLRGVGRVGYWSCKLASLDFPLSLSLHGRTNRQLAQTPYLGVWTLRRLGMG